LVDITIGPVLENKALGFCLDGGCSYFFLDETSLDSGTVLATLRLRVTDDAERYVDVNGGKGYPFDLGVLVDGSERVALPAGQAFAVLAVPESTTSSLTAAGIVLLMVIWRRRRLYISGGVVQPELVAAGPEGINQRLLRR
jgi:hypothetical protein